MQKAKLIKKAELAPSVFEFIFETQSPFNFIPGQYVSLKVDDKKSELPCIRAYSISSIPNGNKFELCIKTIEKGRGSSWISALTESTETENTEIEFMGPIGKFTFKDDRSENILFLAVGAGITPLKSLIESELKKGNKKNMHLIFGVRYIKDIFYKDFFEALAKTYANFKFTLVLSRPESDSWQGEKGHITDTLDKLEINPSQTSAYICGLLQMIKDAETTLLKKGVPQEKIYFEKFD